MYSSELGQPQAWKRLHAQGAGAPVGGNLAPQAPWDSQWSANKIPSVFSWTHYLR